MQWPPALPNVYYQDDAVCIVHADCRDILPLLPDKSIDLVLTDPPYGLNYNDGDLAHHWESAFGDDTSHEIARPVVNDSEDDALRLLEFILTQCRDKLYKGACFCCCCCGGGGPEPLFATWTLLIDRILGFKQAVVWDKGGLGMGIHFRRNYEFILIGQNGDPCRVWNGGNTTPNIWHIRKIIPTASEHPTAKPVELMGKPILLFTNPRGVVLDPCMGTGPTVAAAKKLGRKAIGIEIEEKYCEIAANRCRQSVMKLEDS